MSKTIMQISAKKDVQEYFADIDKEYVSISTYCPRICKNIVQILDLLEYEKIVKNTCLINIIKYFKRVKSQEQQGRGLYYCVNNRIISQTGIEDNFTHKYFKGA